MSLPHFKLLNLKMETSLIFRVILIVASSFSIVCQIISLLGHGWFGFTLAMTINGTTLRQHVDSGLFYRSPYEICIETYCKTPDQFPLELRTMFQEIEMQLDERFDVPKALLITGLAISLTGTALLYIYMCMSIKINKLRCTGIACGVSWMFVALLGIIVFGIEITRYEDDSKGMKHLEAINKVIGQPFEGELMTPWAIIILGIGSCLALIVWFVVFLTTCGKRFDKTVILYRELKDKEGECLIKYNEDEDD